MDDMASLPESLLAACEKRTEQPSSGDPDAPSAGEPIPVGVQDDRLYRLACSLRARGWNRDGILAHLRDVPLDIDPTRKPYTEADYRRLAASACKRPAGDIAGRLTHTDNPRPLHVVPDDPEDCEVPFGETAKLRIVAPPEAFPTRTVTQILTDPLPSPLVGRLIDVGAFASFYGPEWSGKSLLALDINLSLAAGIPCCLGIPLNQAPVLYVLAEGTLRSRIQAWQYAHPGANLDAFRSHEAGFSFADEKQVDALLASVERTVPALVTFDTLAATIGGDENSSVDMGRVIAVCQEIQRLTSRQTATLLLAHPGKDASKGIRGHSSLPAALEQYAQVIGVESPKYANEVAAGEPTGGSVTIRPRKNREGAKGKDIGAAIRSGGESVYLAHDARALAVSPGGMAMLRQLAEAEGGMAWNRWGVGLDYSPQYIGRERTKLLDAGLVTHSSFTDLVAMTNAGEAII